jgi:hypothetical protein
VDGSLIDAWASQKSFMRKDGSDDDPPKGSDRNAGRNFHGERRCNETHASKTDPDALMFRKSQAHPAKLCYAGQVLMEKRHGLVAEAQVVRASGSAERDTAIEMLSEVPGTHPMTVGADKASASVDVEGDSTPLYQVIAPKEAGSFEEWLESVNAHRKLKEGNTH